ncbi:capsular biosynthesis protein [Croceibacterium aestuarii]|uniref:capsular biosynthesis protein n=1 Tax=Croceibacterium aestuarii TaxID=3064139 RepID=UPI00272EB0FF|nr:capsular biosynthesis protein [Croceibacterium sp. D39]
MTEQSKIPLPEAGKGEGERKKSLFERVDDLFGFGGAPVPTELAQPPQKRGKKTAAPVLSAEVAKDTEHTFAEPGPAADLASDRSVQAKAAPIPAAPTPVEPAVTFAAKPQTLDRNHLRQQGLIEPGGKVTALLEEFRIVKREVLLAARTAQANGGGAKAQRVLICSPLPGEGKTFCAANLALAMAAEKDSEVVLVDADFAKPSILSTLGLAGGRGLMDALADPSLRVESFVLATDVPGLYVLPAGNQTNSDSEFLSSKRTAAVLDRLTQGAPNRLLIFDSPPALAASPAAELAKYVGQALVVARADLTGQSALEDALSLLSNCPDIKLLLNAAQYSPSGRRFGTYYGYGE